jgi:hypothetical protein
MVKKYSKEVRTLFRKLLICIILQELIKGNITIVEVYDLINKASDAKRLEQLKKEEEKKMILVNEQNKQFQNFVEKLKKKKIKSDKKDESTEEKKEYKSFFSVD